MSESLEMMMATLMVLGILVGWRKTNADPKSVRPGWPRMLARKARHAEKQGQYQLAGDFYRMARQDGAAIEMYKRAQCHRNVADLYEQGRQWVEAAQFYEAAGDLQRAVEVCHKMEQRFESAEILNRLGRPEQSIPLLQELDPADPDFERGSLLLGQILLGQGCLEDARHCYRRLFSARRTGANVLGCLYRLAQSLEKTEQYPEALMIYEQILAEDFHYADVKGCAYGLRQKLGKFEKAVPETEPVSHTPPVAGMIQPGCRYRIIKKIGQGEMGVVYQAEDTLLRRSVVCKVLTAGPGRDSELGTHFLQEARIAATLSHANIITIHDVGIEQSGISVTMEHIEGTTLKEILARDSSLPLPELLDIADQICAGLDFAHQSGVVHHDLKPSNIMIGHDGSVKIMDFSIARVVHQSLEDGPFSRGAPFTMSPEQVRNEEVDFRSDIYSFGCMLYQMATGKTPFGSENLLMHHLKTVPIPPMIRHAQVPLALNQIILKCMEKDRLKRYQTVHNLHTDLQAVPRNLRGFFRKLLGF